MVRPLMHDPIFLARKSVPCTPDDLAIVQDLRDTLTAHQERCVGMAANMIGESKCIIAFFHNTECMVMLNPEIIKQTGEYETEESCLSLLGGPRKTKRFKSVKVRYQNTQFQVRIRSFSGLSAQIIQHEMDHCNGILI